MLMGHAGDASNHLAYRPQLNQHFCIGNNVDVGEPACQVLDTHYGIRLGTTTQGDAPGRFSLDNEAQSSFDER